MLLLSLLAGVVLAETPSDVPPGVTAAPDAPPPRPGAAVLSASGNLTHATAAAALAQVMPALRRCWQQGANVPTPTSGDVVVTIGFRSSGFIKWMTTDMDTAEPSSVSSCVKDALGSIDARTSGTATFQSGHGVPSPDPAPSSADPAAPPLGSLDKAVIDAVIKRNIGPIRYCYRRVARSKPYLAGKVTVRFVIAPNGTVTSAETKATTMNNADVEACVNSVFREMRFPEPGGGGRVIVSYPIIFARRR